MPLPKERPLGEKLPTADDEVRLARMDEMEEFLLTGHGVHKSVRHFTKVWGLGNRAVDGIVALVRQRWKERADERNDPASKAVRHEELVSMVRQTMASALQDGKHQVALVATQQLAYLEGLNQQTVNVVHSGTVTVSDDRLPFELLRAFAEVLRIADVETRRVLCSDVDVLMAENRPAPIVIEAEGLRVLK